MDKDHDVCEWCRGTGYCFWENRSSHREVCRCVNPPFQVWPTDEDAAEAERLAEVERLERVAQSREETVPWWLYEAGMEVCGE